MQELLRKLGSRIKAIRKLRKLTQERLAEKIDISPRYLSRLEVGQQSPSVEMVAKLAVALKVEMWELFDFRHEEGGRQLQETLRKLVRESDEQTLRLAVKVFRSVLR